MKNLEQKVRQMSDQTLLVTYLRLNGVNHKPYARIEKMVDNLTAEELVSIHPVVEKEIEIRYLPKNLENLTAIWCSIVEFFQKCKKPFENVLDEVFEQKTRLEIIAKTVFGKKLEYKL